ncbi:MAG: RHS repeat-associated core domain-containing protein [Candidatus Aenigmatarchaeota archaeon]
MNDFTFTNPSILQETPNKTYDYKVLTDGNRYAYRIFKNVPTEGLFFYHTDHLMTPLQMTDESQSIVWQAEYYPFGRIYSFSAEIENNLRFPGQYADFSVSKANLYYNFFRWYKNNIGRYIRTDINVYFSFIIDENVYAYAKGNSINIYDFYGLSSAAHICCDGKGGFTICWDQNIPEGIIKKCIEEHEKDHINYMERNNPCACKNKPPKEKRFTMERSKYNEMECSGYRVEYCCIERNWPFIPDKAEALKRKIKLQNEAKKFNCPKDNWKCKK